MERIVVGRSATLSHTFTFTPTGTPSVVLTRVSDGTTVTTGSVSGAATTWSYTIPAASNTLLDTYVETWTATTGGSAQTFTDYVEVAGGVLFTLADARALKPLDNTTYPDAAITDMRTTVEQELEQACGVAFVPRYALDTVDGTGGTNLLLTRPRIRRIRSVSVSGTAWDQATLDAFTYRPGGVVYSATPWTYGYGNLQVGYEHGYDSPPAGVRRAALILARMWLTGQSRPIDDRAITFNAGADGGTYSLAVPGRNGSEFGHPDVDVIVQRYGMAVGVA